MEYNNEKLLNIKKEKIILYLTKVVAELNHSCNNIITKEKICLYVKNKSKKRSFTSIITLQDKTKNLFHL